MSIKNKAMISAGITLLLLGAALVYFSNFRFGTIWGAREREISGTVRDISLGTKVITVGTADGRELSLALVPDTEVFDEVGKKISLEAIREGFIIRAEAKFTGLIAIPSIIRITDSPRIIVYSPKPGETLYGTVYLTGSFLVFENTVQYRVMDENSDVLASGFAANRNATAGEYGDFQEVIKYRFPKGETGRLEVFEISAKGGKEINTVTVPIQFASLAKNTK